MSASLRPLVLLLPVGVLADQLSKRWAEDHVRMRGVVTLVPDLLDLRYARNPGAFFSLGADLAETPRRIALIAAGVSILGLMLWMYFRTTTEQVRLRWALSLLAAGAIGNLVDRVRVGEVVDFVYLHAGALLHWATFNVADVLITAGLLLLGLDLVRPHAHAPFAPQPGTNGGH